MKNLTPAKLVMLVFVAMAGMIFLYVVKTLTARETPPPVAATRVVPMPVGDLEPGTVIKEEHLGRGPWPAADIKDDVLLGEGGIVGRVVKLPMKAAEPIHGNDLYAHGELPPLSVSEGFRAVTLSIREQAAIMNGLIKPGDFVDIQFSPEDMRGDPRYQLVGGLSIKLFKGVRVLALNRDFVQTPLQASENSVTLEIAEEDTGILDLCSKRGELTLQFTNTGTGRATVQVADPNRPTLEEILQLPEVPEEPEPPAPPEPDRFTSRVYRQSGMTTMRFQDGVPTGNTSNWIDSNDRRNLTNDPDDPTTAPATNPNAAPNLPGNVSNMPNYGTPNYGAAPYGAPYPPAGQYGMAPFAGAYGYPGGYGPGYAMPPTSMQPVGPYGAPVPVQGAWR